LVDAGAFHQSRHEIPTARIEVFAEIVEHLRPVMGCCCAPASGLCRRIHRVANVLAIADPGLTYGRATLTDDRRVVAAIRARLLAAVTVLHRTNDAAYSDLAVTGRRSRWHEGFRNLGRGERLYPIGDKIFVHALACAFATEPAFAVAAETGSGIQHVGAVDPDDTGLHPRRKIERDIDVFRPD